VNSHEGAVLDQLDRLFNRGTVAGLSEGALLERYVAGSDEAAFAALVARHGPMVLGVCRRVLRDERDVEDAFQATFLVLVRRAGAIRDGELVGRWLHGVAHRVAVRARAHSARRFVHEQSVDEPIETRTAVSASDAAERLELASIVDEEVTRLPSNLRAPVVLCYLEGMSHDEAARRLRWPVGTVRSRMARARDVLRQRLARRGVTTDGAAIVTALARPPVPPEWIGATVRGSLNFATYPATAAATIASARSVAIARRLLQTMVITKLSYIGAAGLGIALAFGGAGTLAFQGAGNAKPIGLAAAASQTSGAQDPAPKEPTAARSRSDPSAPRTQSAAVVHAINSLILWHEIESELKRSTTSLEKLQVRVQTLKSELEEVEKFKSELEAIRRGERADSAKPAQGSSSGHVVATTSKPDTSPGEHRPSHAQPASSTPAPSTSAKKDETASDSDRPQYIALGQLYMVVSPDGSKVGTYDPSTGKNRPVRLPAIRGIRRELKFTGINGFIPREITRTGVVISGSGSPWFVALDLDRDRKVTRIAALNVLDDTWIDQDITEPVDRSSIRPAAAGHVYTIGRRVYGFSAAAKRWGVLEFPLGVAPATSTRGSQVWAEKEGRLFVWNPGTGIWDDLYARAIEDKPAEPAK
jgi:RNA polymerase sigma factor (sigma-70 family)